MSSKDERQESLEYWRKDIVNIKEDSTHGSIFLSNVALDIVEEFVRKQLYRNRTELIQALSKLSNALVRAKPLMALIYNRTHHVLLFIQNLPKEQKDIISRACRPCFGRRYLCASQKARWRGQVARWRR